MIINNTIEEFVTGLPNPRPQISGHLRVAVDECFSQRNIGDIIGSLTTLKESNNEQIKAWATKTIDTMQQRSPTSVLLTLEQMRAGPTWGIADTFRHEHTIASRFMAHPDFVEGVFARLVRRQKERPNWQPASFDEVRPQDVESFFAAPPTLELLDSSPAANYREYPHKWLGLPRESYILQKAQQLPDDRAVVQHFVREYNGKAGVKEKVEEVLERSKI